MNLIALSDFVGSDEPLDPASMRFTSRPTSVNSCQGCVFRGQRSKVCKEATRLALRAGMPDCDDGYVYVPIVVDPRQLVIV